MVAPSSLSSNRVLFHFLVSKQQRDDEQRSVISFSLILYLAVDLIDAVDDEQDLVAIGSRRSSWSHQRNNKGVRFNDDVMGRSLHNLNHELQSLSSEHGRLKHEIQRTNSLKHKQRELINPYVDHSARRSLPHIYRLGMTVMAMIHSLPNRIHSLMK